MKDPSNVMSEEGSPVISLIAPLHAQLIQDTTDGVGQSPLVREMKQAIDEDLRKRYTSNQERHILHTASALDPRVEGLPFLTEEERVDTYSRETAQAASREVILPFYYM